MVCSSRERAIGFGNVERASWNFLWLNVNDWRKASVMLRPRLAPILFSRQVQPAYICLPSRNGHGGRGYTCDLLVPNPDASGLLTLHSEKWLPDLDSHQDKRLNRPPCYFDTTWQWLIGAAGRTSTCIVPLRRLMPDVFDHGSGTNGAMEWWSNGLME